MLPPPHETHFPPPEPVPPSHRIQSEPCCLYRIANSSTALARAAVTVVLDVNVNRVIKVAAELLRLFLGEGVSGNHYNMLDLQIYSFKNTHPQKPGQC